MRSAYLSVERRVRLSGKKLEKYHYGKLAAITYGVMAIAAITGWLVAF